MKTTLQLHKEVTINALTTHLNMLKRKQNKETNAMIHEILHKDIAEIQTAINTAAESK